MSEVNANVWKLLSAIETHLISATRYREWSTHIAVPAAKDSLKGVLHSMHHGPSRSQFDLHSYSRSDSPHACHAEGRGFEPVARAILTKAVKILPIRRVNFCAEDRPAGFAIRSPTVAIATQDFCTTRSGGRTSCRQRERDLLSRDKIDPETSLSPFYEATCVVGSCEREGCEHNGGTCAGDAASGDTPLAHNGRNKDSCCPPIVDGVGSLQPRDCRYLNAATR